jgi:hypothetical protein
MIPSWVILAAWAAIAVPVAAILKARRNRAADTAIARHESAPLPCRARWAPAPAPPLSDKPGGEAEQWAGLICAYRAEAAPEPVYDPGETA